MNIPTLAERDAELERLWTDIEDVPFDPETETFEEPILGFPAGTPREDVWHWFDERHSKGVAYLLYGDTTERTNEKLCFECTSVLCAYNHIGECRFAMVHEHLPHFTENDGCTQGCIDSMP
jgi:hypothetical protein